MAEMMESYRGTIYPWHCDHVGHMNVMYYVGKFDEGSWQLLHRLGITPAFRRENHRGVAAVSQRIAYRRELHAGDVIYVRSGILEMRGKIARIVHEMRNVETDEISAVMELTCVLMDTKARKAVPFPEEVRRKAEALTVNYDIDCFWPGMAPLTPATA